MNDDLRAWLLDGEPLPDGLDADLMLADDDDARALADELAAIDAMAADLPDLAPPPHLDAAILALIDVTPQDAPSSLPPAEAEPEAAPAPANVAPRRGRWWVYAASAITIAAVGLLAIGLPRSTDGIGNPDDWTARGDMEAVAGVDLRLAVQAPSGQIDRFERGHHYQAGDTLLFRYDAHAAGWVNLVRVSRDGAEIVHQQEVMAGTGDLRTDGGLVGYSFEPGEDSAVFALIRTDAPIDPDELADALAGKPDVEGVCAAARGLGGRCAAERVEGVQ
jgi:hypothetical protein